MMRLTIPAFVIVLLAAATILLRSPSPSADISSGTAAMPSLQELHAAGFLSPPRPPADGGSHYPEHDAIGHHALRSRWTPAVVVLN